MKLSLTLNARCYTIEVEEPFAQFVQKHLEYDFPPHTPHDVKTLLEAYIRTLLALYEEEETIKAVVSQWEQLPSVQLPHEDK